MGAFLVEADTLYLLVALLKGGVARSHVISISVFKIARVEEFLEIQNTLVLSSIGTTITIGKENL
jgi:hypothetical protein